MLVHRSLLRPSRPSEAAQVSHPLHRASAGDAHWQRSSPAALRAPHCKQAPLAACSSSYSAAQLSASARRIIRSPLVVRADASARVKGDVKRVFLYLTDVTSWTGWYPGISSATRTLKKASGCNQDVGTRFVLEQKLAGFKVLTT